jgi:hypothetical protein
MQTPNTLRRIGFVQGVMTPRPWKTPRSIVKPPRSSSTSSNMNIGAADVADAAGIHTTAIALSIALGVGVASAMKTGYALPIGIVLTLGGMGARVLNDAPIDERVFTNVKDGAFDTVTGSMIIAGEATIAASVAAMLVNAIVKDYKKGKR